VPHRYRENAFLFALVVAGAFLAACGLSYAGSDRIVLAKYAVAAIIAVVFAVAPYRVYSTKRLLLTVALLFFPVTITIGGKDALSTGSLAILFMACAYEVRLLWSKKGSFRPEGLLWVATLILIALAGALSAPRSFWGPELRHFLNFATAALFFLVLVNAPRFIGANRIELARRLAGVVIWMTLFQIFVGIVIYYHPVVGKFLSVFLVRTEKELAAAETLYYVRMASIVLPPEAVGEILAILCPLTLYLVFEGTRRYWVVYGLMAAGLLLANTRSGILLFAVASAVMVLIYGFRLKWFEAVVIFVGVPATFFVLAARRPEMLQNVASRLLIVWQSLQGRRSIVEIFQREMVWYDAWDVTRRTLSLFGNGPAPSRLLGLNELNMHSLYLTLIYQFGIVGGALYLGLILMILLRLLVPRGRTLARLRNLRIACALALVCFLVNEIKFEFNRGDSYQQIIWVMLAVFYLVARTGHDEFVAYLHGTGAVPRETSALEPLASAEPQRGAGQTEKPPEPPASRLPGGPATP